jgi:DeoR family fructose operon transcriptional repressor
MMLFGEERKAKIVEYVNRNQRAMVQELCQAFDVSEATIRRDLKELEDAKLLKRTHGGAISLESVNYEAPFADREITNQAEKIAIAKKAVELIENGDTILLDSGTTTLQLAKLLSAFTNLSVVTNSLLIAKELQHLPGIETLVTGGTLRKETIAMVGPIADHTLSMIRVDKAFVATNGLDVKVGLTTPNLIEAATKRSMIQSAKQVILLTDRSKFGKVSLAKFADVSDIHVCITDQGTPGAFVEQLESRGIEMILV